MYRDSFHETGLMRFLRALAASFRLGRFFGVEVRVYWLALVILPLVLMRNVRFLPFIEAFTYIALITLFIYLVIWVHEMGHIVAGRRYGVQTPLITLSPLGGLAHMSSGAPSPKKEIVISLAGPATHLLWLAVFFPLSLVLTHGDLAPSGWRHDPVVTLVEVLVYINIFLAIFNLLPLFPMDGGRVFRAWLAMKMHPNLATMKATKVGSIGGWLFILAGIYMWVTQDDLWGPVLACIGISNLLACKQERMAAQYSAGPYMTADPLQPWQSDPDAWKGGGGQAWKGGGVSKPGFFARRKARREERRRERDAEAQRTLDSELDRILERVNQVGLDGLTARERKILMKASEKRRGRS